MENTKELAELLAKNLAENEVYLEALNIVKENSEGKMWLIGSGVYKTILNILYGNNYNIKDWDFVAEKIKSNLSFDKGWTIGETKGGNPKLKKNGLVIDLIALDNIHSIKARNLTPDISNYLTGTPLTVQSIAFEINDSLLLGDMGIQSILTETVSINNESEYNYEKGVHGATYSVERYADILGFRKV